MRTPPYCEGIEAVAVVSAEEELDGVAEANVAPADSRERNRTAAIVRMGRLPLRILRAALDYPGTRPRDPKGRSQELEARS
jgi:hypothetical protein